MGSGGAQAVRYWAEWGGVSKHGDVLVTGEAAWTPSVLPKYL